jgi:hypothetical protein
MLVPLLHSRKKHKGILPVSGTSGNAVAAAPSEADPDRAQAASHFMNQLVSFRRICHGRHRSMSAAVPQILSKLSR